MYITWADAVEEGLRLVADLEVNESEIQRDKQEPRDVGSIFARLNALNDERRALEASQQGSVKEADLKGGEAGVPSCRSEPGRDRHHAGRGKSLPNLPGQCERDSGQGLCHFA
jgi:hypothetical protein